ncbi:unnamed protein product [Protopolystoma xenopodis]|uniref:Uncharacterized protein n=1 Tax=Protopolystoma xenopodis TaxID=117903 RepID=A0A3S5CR62_9PLAT|nr:unnamed protein product [Protopolystoma xenopodis]
MHAHSLSALDPVKTRTSLVCIHSWLGFYHHLLFFAQTHAGVHLSERESTFSNSRNLPFSSRLVSFRFTRPDGSSVFNELKTLIPNPPRHQASPSSATRTVVLRARRQAHHLLGHANLAQLWNLTESAGEMTRLGQPDSDFRGETQ